MPVSSGFFTLPMFYRTALRIKRPLIQSGWELWQGPQQKLQRRHWQVWLNRWASANKSLTHGVNQRGKVHSSAVSSSLHNRRNSAELFSNSATVPWASTRPSRNTTT